MTKKLAAVLNLKLVYVLVEKSAIPASADKRLRRHPRLLLDPDPATTCRTAPTPPTWPDSSATHQPSEEDSSDVARALVEETPREAFRL